MRSGLSVKVIVEVADCEVIIDVVLHPVEAGNVKLLALVSENADLVTRC